MPFDHYVGTTFHYAGTLQLTGETPYGTAGVNKNQPDFSQWSVNAWLYDQAGEKQVGSITVTNNSNPALPASNGLYQLYASAAETATWPIGKTQLVLQVTTDVGDVKRPKPIFCRVLASPGVGQ